MLVNPNYPHLTRPDQMNTKVPAGWWYGFCMTFLCRAEKKHLTNFIQDSFSIQNYGRRQEQYLRYQQQ